MNEDRRTAAENQAWEELLDAIDPADAWIEGIEDGIELVNAVRELGQFFGVLPAEVQRQWKPYLESLRKIDYAWIAQRTDEIEQEADEEELSDRLAREEGDQNA